MKFKIVISSLRHWWLLKLTTMGPKEQAGGRGRWLWNEMNVKGSKTAR